ncbi:protein sidekick-2-like [Corticium candelabrum]|uniref:protein sidekick-2-like n=1 Tax=Corticium candelabrum TaxID=121492 RepID=UPI002E263E86|nr:protein sidekick-2-like [Corticium candelabrum]
MLGYTSVLVKTRLDVEVGQCILQFKAGEQGSNTLTITSAKKIDTGTYTCEGKNDAGVDMDTVVLQVRVSPDASTNLTAKEKTNISITLSWISGSENFSPINGYEVIYRQTGSSDWMIARNFSDGTTTEQLVDGLMPLTDYDFRVRARNAIGEGEFSDIEKLITHPNAPSLGPTELSYSEVKAVSAKLTWKIVNESLLASNEGNITHYEMVYSYNNQEKSQYTDGVATSGTLTGLLKGANYKVVVYARNSGPYQSPPSNKVSFTTDTTGDFTIFQENQQEKTAFIEGLMPRQEYTVRVTARNFNGFGDPDEIKRTTQTEVVTVTIGTTSETTIQVDWQIELQDLKVTIVNNFAEPGSVVTLKCETDFGTSSLVALTAVTVTIGTTTETTIKVDWQIGNVPDAVTEITVHWGTDLSETLEKGIETYTIKQLNPKTSYTIRVVVSLLSGQEREAIEEVETKALTAIVLRPPETLHVDKDAPGTATCVTSSGAPPPRPVEWRVNNEVVSNTGFITVQDNILTVTYTEELNKAIIVCKVNELTSNEVTVDIPIEGKSSGLPAGTIAAIAVGVILGISIMVIILLIVILRRKQSAGNVKSKSVKELSTAVEENEREAIDDPTYEAIPGTGIPATPLYEDTVIRTSPHYQGILVDNAAYKTTDGENRGNGN